MDEEQGKVIDGTARARQWRGSRPKSSADTDGTEAHSDAPKGIAASLLVPAEMLAGPPTPPASGDDAGAGDLMVDSASAAGSRGTVGAAMDNLLLSPDAAVVNPRKQRA